MTTTTPTSRRVTRYLAAPALALGLAIGSAAVATAEWDIESYDFCMSHQPPTDALADEIVSWFKECCEATGGVWSGTNCGAPPPEAAGRPLPRIPTHVMQPAPLPGPPGDIGPAPGGVVTSAP
jgi:hypothetical protein